MNGEKVAGTPKGRTGKPGGEEKQPLATDPDLMERIADDIATMGLVGERENAKLVYTGYTSRKLAKPLNIIIRGDSSSGKNQIQDIPLRLMPQNDVLSFTGMSRTALFYICKEDPNAVQNKILRAGERSHRTDDDAADQNSAIRQLLSEGRIKRSVTMKQEIVDLVVEGPVMYCETTTSKSIFEEDLNRVLQIHADGSAEQTKRVLRQIQCGYSYENRDNDNRQQSIIELHHAFQDSLKTVKVIVPFDLAEHFPDNRKSYRRLFNMVLATIESVAFLHQHQRLEIDTLPDGTRVIEATQQDYEIARAMLKRSLEALLAMNDSLAKWQLKMIEHCPHGRAFTTSELIPDVFSSRKVANQTIKKMCEAGMVRQVRKGTGKQASKYEWTDCGRGVEYFMPDFDSLSEV